MGLSLSPPFIMDPLFWRLLEDVWNCSWIQPRSPTCVRRGQLTSDQLDKRFQLWGSRRNEAAETPAMTLRRRRVKTQAPPQPPNTALGTNNPPKAHFSWSCSPLQGNDSSQSNQQRGMLVCPGSGQTSSGGPGLGLVLPRKPFSRLGFSSAVAPR